MIQSFLSHHLADNFLLFRPPPPPPCIEESLASSEAKVEEVLIPHLRSKCQAMGLDHFFPGKFPQLANLLYCSTTSGHSAVVETASRRYLRLCTNRKWENPGLCHSPGPGRLFRGWEKVKPGLGVDWKTVEETKSFGFGTYQRFGLPS